MELAGGRPSDVTAATVEVTGHLQLTVRWQPPARWDSDESAGTATAKQYEVLVLPDGNPLLVYKVVVPDTTSTSFVIDPQTAAGLQSTADYAPNSLQFAAGKQFNFYVLAYNTDDLPSIPAQTTPAKIMVIGRASPPVGVHICNRPDGHTECSHGTPPLSMLVTWLGPSDTGAGASKSLRIQSYEVVVAEGAGWSTSVRTLNISSDLMSKQDVGRYTLSGLSKGRAYSARVRAYNQVGAGDWAASVPVFIVMMDAPGEPLVQFIGSGADVVPFLTLFWRSPSDRGAGIDSPFNNDGNMTIMTYRVQVGMTANLSNKSAAFIDLNDDNTTALGEQLNWTIYSINDAPLSLGTTYFMRMKASNGVGFGNWSAIFQRTLVQRPGTPQSLRLQSVGLLQMNASWAAPNNRGVGFGIEYPHLSYSVVIQTTGIAPDMSASSSIILSVPGHMTHASFSNLSKGLKYYAFVRAHNDAAQYPNEIDSGYGPWALALAHCIDGMERPTVCNGSGVVAIELPAIPPGFRLRPIGDGMLIASWNSPLDTGDGTSTYPLLRYQVQFADNDQFSNAVTFSVIRRDTFYRTGPGQFQVGSLKFSRVQAVNDAGFGAWSSPQSATVLLAPGTPKNLSAINANLSIHIIFERPSNTGAGATRDWPLLGYIIDIWTPVNTCPNDPSRHRSWPVANSSQSMRNNVTVSGLFKGCKYLFRMRAYNEAGPSNFSEPLFESILELSSKPTNLVAVPGLALQLIFKWDVPRDAGDGAPSNASLILRYQVEISQSTNFEGNLLYRGETSDQSVTVSFLPRSQLFARVFPVTRAGRGHFAQVSGTPIIPVLASTSIAFTSFITGAEIEATIRLTITSELRQNDLIAIRFPAGYIVSDIQLQGQGSSAGMASKFMIHSRAKSPCGTDCHTSLEMVSIKYNDSIHLPARSNIVLSFHNIFNRRWSGATESFEFRVLNPDGLFTIAEDLNVSKALLLPGNMASLRVDFDDKRTGKLTTARVKLTVGEYNQWLPQDFLVIEFPPSVDISGALMIHNFSATSSSQVQMGSLLATSVHDQRLKLKRFGGDILPVSTSVSFSISNIRNSMYANQSGPFLVMLMTNSSKIIDRANFSGIVFAPGNLSNASVTLLNSSAYAIGDVHVCFQCGAVGLPLDSQIEVVFPADYIVDTASVDISQNVDGNVDISVHDQTVRVMRTGQRTLLGPNSRVCLVFQKIRNRYAGQTQQYSITTLAPSGVVVEQLLRVPGNMIRPAQMKIGKLELSTYAAGADVDLEIGFTIQGALNFRGTEGGRIVVEFPSGFEISPVDSSPLQLTASRLGQSSLELNGTWTATTGSLYPIKKYSLPDVVCTVNSWMVCGSAVAIKVKGTEEFLAGTKVLFTLTGLRTRPVSGPTDALRVYTLNANNYVSDLANASLYLKPNNLSAVSIGPSPLITNATVTMILSFLTTNILPENCQIQLFFPAAFSMTAELSVSSSLLTFDLVVTQVFRSYFGTNVTLSRRPNIVLSRGSNITIALSGIRTRMTSGKTGTIDIFVKTAANRTIDQALSVEAPYLEYSSPHPKTTIPFTNSPSSGYGMLSVAGSGFGLFECHPVTSSNHRAARIGHTSCASTKWISDSLLTCLISSGILSSDLVVTIEKKVGTGRYLFSYDVPYGVNVTQFFNSPSSSTSGSIFGGNFGMSSTSITARVGVSAAEQTVWTSDTLLLLKSAGGFGASLSVVMTIGSFPGSLSDVFSYDSTILSSAVPLNIAFGTHSLNFSGSNFGLHDFCPRARSYGTRCEATTWISLSSLLCKVTPKNRCDTADTALTVAFLIGTLSGLLSFDMPVLTSISIPRDQILPSQLMMGKRLINVEGSQFSSADVSGIIQIGNTECLSTAWTSDSSLTCQIDSFVNIEPLTVHYRAEGQLAGLFEYFSMDGPLLSGLANSNKPVLIETQHFFLFGNNNGAYFLSASSRIGGTTCQSTLWLSDTSIMSKPAHGAGLNENVVVTMSRACATMTGILSHDFPALTSTVPHQSWGNNPASGGKYLVMSGINLGLFASTHNVRIGHTDCEHQIWSSDTCISCKVSRGWGKSVDAVVTILRAEAETTHFHSYDVLDLAFSRSSNLPTLSKRTSSTFLTGSNLGSYSNSLQGRLGGSACSRTVWYSQTSISCQALEGTGSFHTMALSVARLSITRSHSFSYDAPFSCRLRGGGNSPITGSKQSMDAANLGGSQFSSKYRGGQTSCAGSNWISDSSLLCKMGAGAGHDLNFAITVTRQFSTAKRTMTYDFPSFLQTFAANGPGSGHSVHSISGLSFGVFSLSPRTAIGASSCTVTSWVSDSALTLVSAHGMSGVGQSVVLTIALKTMMTKTNVFTYDAPVVLDVTGLDDGISGGLITLTGNGFGSADYTIMAKINKYGCSQTGWIAETSVICKLNPGTMAGDVTLSAVRDAVFCRKCLPGMEILVGCASGVGGNAGTCLPCDGCPKGHYRDCEFGGTGACLPCRNERENVDQRFYKNVEGNGQTRCSPCTVCGGSNQEGTQYERQRCTIYKDTTCQDCPACSSGIRVGCAASFMGICEQIAEGVPGISATASGYIQTRKLAAGKHLTTASVVADLTGDNRGTGITIYPNALIDFPENEVQNISVSAIIPSEIMLSATKDVNLVQGRRQSDSQNDLFSKIVYISPVGLKLMPGGNLTFRIDPRKIPNRNAVALFEWNRNENIWKRRNQRLTFAEKQVSVIVENFSIYVIMGLSNETRHDETVNGMPYQMLIIILSTVVTLVVLVCSLIFIFQRHRRRYKESLEASKSAKYSFYAQPNRNGDERSVMIALPSTPGKSPRTPRTPVGASSPVTPYGGISKTQNTASWKRHLFAQSPRALKSPLPKLPFLSWSGSQQDEPVNSTNTGSSHRPKSAGKRISETTRSSNLTKRLPVTDFSSRKAQPSDQNLESNLELLSSAFLSPQLRADAAHKAISQDSLLVSDLKAQRQMPDLRAHATDYSIDSRLPPAEDLSRVAPQNDCGTVLFSSPRFGRNLAEMAAETARFAAAAAASSPARLSHFKEGPRNSILAMTHDYGDKAGMCIVPKQVRSGGVHEEQSERTLPKRHAPAHNPATAFSPRKLELNKQTIRPSPVLSMDVTDRHLLQSPRIRVPSQLPSKARILDDDISPSRHSGPRDKRHEPAYSRHGPLVPSFGRFPAKTKPPGNQNAEHDRFLRSSLKDPELTLNDDEESVVAQTLLTGNNGGRSRSQSSARSPARAWDSRDMLAVDSLGDEQPSNLDQTYQHHEPLVQISNTTNQSTAEIIDLSDSDSISMSSPVLDTSGHRAHSPEISIRYVSA